MQDKKMIDAAVSKIAARGGASTGFSQRLAAAKAAKTPRTASVPSRASSTAPPSPVVTGKGAKPTKVKQAATAVPDVVQGKKGPTMPTGAGSKASGGHTFNITIRNQ